MAQSIEELSKYLSYERSYGSMVLTSVESEEIDQTILWEDGKLPWNRPTCLAVVYYVMKFCSNFDQGIGHLIICLNELASKYNAKAWEFWDEFTSLQEERSIKLLSVDDREISELFVNDFMPMVEIYFKVPKLQELPDKANLPKENEVLAGFMDFLLQILNCEAHINSEEEQRYALLQKELTFILSFLGDVPFLCIELEDVKNLLVEFEDLANEAGRFIYSCVFATHPIKENRFIVGREALLKMVEQLNVKIEEYCIKFSKLPMFVTPKKADCVDSLFIVDSLIEDLENLVSGKIVFNIEGMKDQIKALHDGLTFSRSFLKDIGMPRDTVYMDELYGSLVKIRDVAYEAEYLVNSHIAGNLPFWYLNLRLPAVIRSIMLIGGRFQEIKKLCGIKFLKITKDYSGEVSAEAMGTPKTMINDNMVGFEVEKENILYDLIGGTENRKIITIFGMPGLGKTTLARDLYNNLSIHDHFDRRVWCVVSQTYQKRKVLVNILMGLTSKTTDNFLKMEDDSLTLEIHQCLKNRRYFIVIDDVWSSNVWDDLERYFPDDENRSRILFTSQNKDVVPTYSIFYTLPLLTEKKCWELLKKKAFIKESFPTQLLDIGERIAAKCKGLPLAVVVTAGILINLEKKEEEWRKVETNLDSYLSDDTNIFTKILELSYKHLPNHLKLCFLYFSAFPKGKVISVRKLVRLWIAEGFVQREEPKKSLEQVAEEYLFDLVSRSLVLIANRRSDGGVKACSIHDLLRDMCLGRAHEENFLKSITDRFSIYEKHHRLHVHSTSPADQRPFGLQCRSFSGHLSQPSSSFPQMPLLRVMNLLPIFDDFYELQRIDLLVQLRYLVVDRMPKTLLGNLVNLEFLCVESTNKVYIPSVVLKMAGLRHLHIREAEFEKDVDSSQTTNLRSLSRIHINTHKDEEILRCSPHLLKLKCICNETVVFPDVCSFAELESLHVLRFRPLPRALPCELTKINFPPTIKKLSLSGIRLLWEEISVIGRLPNLHVLKLAFNGFIGEEWKTVDGEFQELRFLKLECIDLKQWITNSEHFPSLQCLMFCECRQLEKIPSEIGDIMTLQTIELIYCSYEACVSAVQIEKEQRENGNEELKVIITSW